MEQGHKPFKLEPFELPEGTIVRVSNEYPDHVHFTDPYGGEVNLPVRDLQLAAVRLLLRLAHFLPARLRPAKGQGKAPAYESLRRSALRPL